MGVDSPTKEGVDVMSILGTYPVARTPVSVVRDSGLRVWTTSDELEWLGRLRKQNPEVFDKYKETFFTRKEWGRVDSKTIARYLGL